MTVTARNNISISDDYMGEKEWWDAKSVGRKKETVDR